MYNALAELHIESNPQFLLHDMGMSKLFYEILKDHICYEV